tara:strand:+ start:284 stop:550 length:267 start_codon:yes stop_codon:yes gene_type:complete
MVEVQATLITKRKIFYECPFCWSTKKGDTIYDSQYFKNGKVAENRFKTTHAHGNDTQEFENREEHRGSHCIIYNAPICIMINDETERK